MKIDPLKTFQHQQSENKSTEKVILKNWKTENYGNVTLFCDSSTRQFSAYVKKEGGDVIEIKQNTTSSTIDGIPSGIKELNIKQLKRVFADTFIRLQLLNNFTKLSISQRGRGGVNFYKIYGSKEKFIDHIKKRLPKGTYTSVNVRLIDRQVQSSNEKISCFEIALELTIIEKLRFECEKIFKENNSNCLPTDIRAALFALIFDDTEVDVARIEENYKNGHSLYLYFSPDFEYIEMNLVKLEEKIQKKYFTNNITESKLDSRITWSETDHEEPQYESCKVAAASTKDFDQPSTTILSTSSSQKEYSEVEYLESRLAFIQKVNPSQIAAVLQACDDTTLADRVREKVPRNTYISIQVRTVMFRFGAHVAALKSREVVFELTKTQTVFAFLRNFFSGLGLLDSEDYDDALDRDALERSLVNTIFADEIIDTKPLEEAYQKATSMHLYIAEDASAIHLEFQESREVRGSYKIGHAGRVIMALYANLWAVVSNNLIHPQEETINHINTIQRKKTVDANQLQLVENEIVYIGKQTVSDCDIMLFFDFKRSKFSIALQNGNLIHTSIEEGIANDLISFIVENPLLNIEKLDLNVIRQMIKLADFSLERNKNEIRVRLNFKP